MKIILFVIFVIHFHDVLCDKAYTSKYDDVDLDEILNNDRLLANYVKCLKNEGPCTPDAAELKKVMPDAVHTNCQKCTEKQKEGSQKVILFLKKNKTDIWNELEKIYDPTGIYKNNYDTTTIKIKMN